MASDSEKGNERVAVKSLVERLPAHRPEAEELLEIFMGWAADIGLDLYPAQEEAILELLDGRHVILNTPTGSGKSLVAMAAHFRALARGERSFYTSPIKALVSEKFFSLCNTFGAANVGMMTGDAGINTRAPIICCTAEVLANMALRQGAGAPVDWVIMDEFHYYSDRDRGQAWQIPLLVLKNATYLLMSATLGDTAFVQKALLQLTGREAALVKSGQRPVPLTFDYSEVPLGEAIYGLVTKGRYPVYVVNFSQHEATDLAGDLMSSNWCTTPEKQTISKALGSFRFDSPFGKKMRRYVHHGIGLHHAGLLPKYRLLVERLAQQGLMKIIAGTDTLGVGVNVPIRSVLFTRLYKYDGDRRRILTVRDFHQIAGRAGRKGFDVEGFVVCQAPPHVIENSRLEAKAASAKGSKKFVKKQPEKGFVPWDRKTFEALRDGESEPLKSVFHVDHGMLLHLLQRGQADPSGLDGGYRELVRLIEVCHENTGGKKLLRRHAARVFRSLREAGLVELMRGNGVDPARVRLADELGEDFSAFHTLALYLLDTIAQVPFDSPTYALDLLTVVESILENPGPVLYAQSQRARRDLVVEMKAEGVEYEERMAALEGVAYPKPHADFIYDTFNAFVERHPWLERESIRPKSVAREMIERWMSFGEYVNELGLEAAEGVLLRYLSQVWKILVQTVPETYRNDELIEVISYLRSMIERVDSSLLQEWERMLEGADAGDEPTAPRRVDISLDKRAFTSRVRAELHLVVKALSRRDWDDALAGLRVDGEVEWTAELLEASLTPLLQMGGNVVFNHTARLTDRTLIRAVGDHEWEVTQRLLVDTGDPEVDAELEWALRARIDLREDASPSGPLLELLGISE